jgi:hypothetical protein
VTEPGSTETTPPAYLPPKSVIFEYLLAETSIHHRARLPMRVNIYPHDGTDSIITTVKNFYGLYDGNGVSFEDKEGNTLIARYENFADKMTVYIRVIDEVGSKAGTPSVTASPRRPRLQAAFEPQPLNAPNFGISRPSSRAAKKRSASPPSMSGQRSNSVSTIKSRAKKSRVGSIQGDGEYDSDSDGGNASVTSSRRGKADILASAEISVDNIVEGGRRKRARFDSSVCIQPYNLLHLNHFTNNYTGTTTVRAIASPTSCLGFLDLPSKTNWSWCQCLAVPNKSAYIFLQSCAVSTKL